MSNNPNLLDNDMFEIERVRKISITFCIICIAAGIIGIIFKILHWPFGDVLMIFGFGLLCGYLSGVSLILKQRSFTLYGNLSAFIISALMAIRFPYLDVLLLYFGVIVVSFILTYLYGLRRGN